MHIEFSWTLTLFSFLTGVSCRDDSFYFKDLPQSPVRIAEGKPFALSCSVSDLDQIEFFWSLHEKPLRNSTRRYHNGSQLVFETVRQVQDEGTYHCTARNRSSGFTISSAAIVLKVPWIGQEVSIKLLSPMSASALTTGGSVSLKCQAEGSDLKVIWYRNNHQVSIDDRVRVESDTLHISNLSSRDNGVYSCEAENEAGSVDSSDNFVLAVPSQRSAENIVTAPRDVVVPRSEAAVFHCVFADKTSTVVWYARDESPIANASGRITVYPNGTLAIWKVRTEDEGPYRCDTFRSSPTDFATGGYVARLTIANPVKGYLIPKGLDGNKYVVRAGSSLELFCKSKRTFPLTKVKWTDEKGSTVSNGPYLVIEDIEPKQAGTYQCRISNSFGNFSLSANVVVTVLPNVIDEPSDRTHYEGTSFQLMCGYQGSPYPYTRTTWQKYSKALGRFVPLEEPLPRRYTVTNANRGMTSQLQVRSSISEEDSGQYRCEIVTDGFEPVYSEPAKVFVKQHLKFLSKPTVHYLELNETQELHCRAQASEPIKIQWTVPGKKKLPDHVTVQEGVLVFAPAQRFHDGDYLCIAETASERINGTFSVEVVLMPKIVSKPIAEVQAVVGQTVFLDCIATGDPKPVVEWNKDTKRPNSTYMQRWDLRENGTLVIENVVQTDSGYYGCIAGNKAGFVREEIMLVVQAESGTSVTQTVCIIVAFVAAYILLVVVLIVYCKRKATPKAESVCEPMLPIHTAQSVTPGQHYVETYETRSVAPTMSEIPPAPACSLANVDLRQIAGYPPVYGRGTSRTARSTSNPGSDPCRNSPNASSAYSSCVNGGSMASSGHYPYGQLLHMVRIGCSSFGEVFVAESRSAPCSRVLIKTCQVQDDDLRRAFVAQAAILRKMKHDHVVQFLGVHHSGQKSPLNPVILEHSEHGDLWHFMDSYRDQFAAAHLTSIARQIALGMHHLAQERCTHRDLAARNCIVHLLPGPQGPSLQIKVSYISLVKYGPFDRDYCSIRNQLLPVRWMPKELVFDDEPSTFSDVWAYGVTCYEIFTRCTKWPYEEYSDDEVLHLLSSDDLLLPLEGMEHGVADLIRACTMISRQQRPTFSDILTSWAQLTNPDNLMD